MESIMTNKIYWNSNGMYQADYEVLAQKLLPGNGKTGTIEGEMLRAATKLYYDYYNNGMCNNTSGPAKFLLRMNEEHFLNVGYALQQVYHECNTGNYTPVSLGEPLEEILNSVVKYIVSLKGSYTESTLDIYDFSDPDYVDLYDYED